MSARTVGPVTVASSTGAAAGLVLVYVASLFGLEVPEAVAGAVVVLVAVLGGYLAPARGGDHARD